MVQLFGRISPCLYSGGGHEGVGIVVAVGEETKEIAVGDHVGIQVREKKTCYYCSFLSSFKHTK
jgi:D-arabinose 1-dehydrogenase-like Zn-dependent alcohol dehydrogenase